MKQAVSKRYDKKHFRALPTDYKLRALVDELDAEFARLEASIPS